jgi:hypothetical protein
VRPGTGARPRVRRESTDWIAAAVLSISTNAPVVHLEREAHQSKSRPVQGGFVSRADRLRGGFRPQAG